MEWNMYLHYNRFLMAQQNIKSVRVIMESGLRDAPSVLRVAPPPGSLCPVYTHWVGAP